MFNWGKKNCQAIARQLFQSLFQASHIIVTRKRYPYCPGDNTVFGHNLTPI